MPLHGILHAHQEAGALLISVSGNLSLPTLQTQDF